jgi:hypothetical protein
MTPEELQRIVLDADPSAFAEAISRLSEEERRPLAAPAWELYRAIERGEAPRNLSQGLVERFLRAVRLPHGSVERSSTWSVSQLAVLGLCPLERARRIHAWFFRDPDRNALDRVIRDRRPAWLDRWIEHRLEGDFVGIPWALLRRWIRDGVCARPESDGYIRAFAVGMVMIPHPRQPDVAPLSERLKADPELLQHELWRLFEVETRAFQHDYMEQKGGVTYETWTAAVLKLAAEGALDRARLLDATLAALLSALPANLLSGFRRLHEELAPDADETAAREERYLRLLPSRVGHVVGFALDRLASLERSRGIDADGLIAEAGAVFLLPSKGPCLSALALMRRVLARVPERAPAIGGACAPALRHPKREVAESALALLERLPDGALAPSAGESAGAAELVDAALRPRIDALLRRAGMQHAEQSVPPPAEAAASDFVARAARIPAPLLARVGLSSPPVNREMPSEPLRWDIEQCGVLANASPIVPIASLEELIDAATRGVEVMESADEVERILAGLSRFCDQRPDDFALRTGSLVRRIRPDRSQAAGRGLVGHWGGISLLFGDLLHQWLTGEPTLTQTPRYTQGIGVLPFLTWRLRELGERVLHRRAAPLLAAPTHARGWIDPLRFVERLRSEDHGAPLRSDLIQALLRLAPDRRDQALTAAAELPGEIGKLVRFALGGEEKCGVDRDLTLWIAAGRARRARGSLAGELPGAHQELGPDAIEPARIRWRSGIRERQVQGKTYRHPQLEFEIEPAVPPWAAVEEVSFRPDPPAKVVRRLWQRGLDALGRGPRPLLRELPTMTLHRVVGHSWMTPDYQIAWIVRWLACVWPQNQDAYFVDGARAMLLRIDMGAASSEPTYVQLESLFELDRPWGELAMLVLWLALVGRDADARGLATDALIEGAADGRAQAGPLGDVLLRLAEGGWLKLARLAESLAPVARASAAHGRLVAELMERVLAREASLPKSVTTNLELLLEILSRLERSVRDPLRPLLERVRGQSRTATLAKALLAIEGDPAREREAAARDEIEMRLCRAERWLASAP